MADDANDTTKLAKLTGSSRGSVTGHSCTVGHWIGARGPATTPGSVVRLRGVFVLLTMLLAGPALAAAPATPFGPTRLQVTAEQRYELCLQQIRRQNWTKALEVCTQVRNLHRDDPVSVLAELAVADIHYERGEYEQAQLAYQDFKRRHPRHERLGYVTYRIGLSIYERAPKWAGRDQTLTRAAVNVWTGFGSRYPDSEHVDEVEQSLREARGRLARKELIIADFYKRRRAWEATRARAEGASRLYPDTDALPRALALHAEALHFLHRPDEAREVRDRLAQIEGTGGLLLSRLDRVLATEAPEVPEEPTFLRPYQTPAMGMPGGAAGGMGAGPGPTGP